jgi:hypothetical protein
MEDWPDWYQLVPAFVATYGSEELQELEGAAVLLEAIEEQDDVSLTDADLVYLSPDPPKNRAFGKPGPA